MNKHKFVNNKLYVYTDKQMRLLIPRVFSCKFGKPKIYSFYYIGDDTIRALIERIKLSQGFYKINYSTRHTKDYEHTSS